MRTFSILLVDADRKNHEILRKALRKEGRLILSAYSNEEAAKLTSERLLDMIVLDYGSSKQGDSDFMKNKLNKHDKRNIPVFMFSSSNSFQTKLSSYLSGAIRYFSIPVEFEDFLIAIEKFELKKAKGATA